MKNYLKNNLLVIILIILLFALGTFCFLIDGKDFIKIFSILAFIYLLFIGSWMIYAAIKYGKDLDLNSGFWNKKPGYLIQGVILIGASIIILLYPNYLVRLIIGILLIIVPTIKLIHAYNKRKYLRNNFWKFIVGIILIFAIDIILEIMFFIIGGILYACAIFLIYLLIYNYKDHSKPNIITKYTLIYFINKKDKDGE